MADFSVGLASGMAVEIVKSIIAFAKEVQINRAQAKQLGKNCEFMLNQYKSNFQRVIAEADGLAHSDSYHALQESYRNFISVLGTLESEMKKWAKLGFWQRLGRKREIESSIQSFNSKLDEAWKVYQNHLALQTLAVTYSLSAEAMARAKLEDAHGDAEIISNIAKILKKSPYRISIPIRRHAEMSSMEFAAEIERTNSDEDPKLRQARIELRDALYSYEGSYLPHVIDSSELTLLYGQPVRTSANSFLYKGSRKGTTVAIKQLRFEGYTDDLIQHIDLVFKRITHEAELWKDLNHCNVIKFLGCCRPLDELPFLVSPWMEYGDARAYLHTHPNADCLKWVTVRISCSVSYFDSSSLCSIEVAEGLKYLHTFQRADFSTCVPIVHGNLRGSHVLLDGDLNALLSDFGISHLLNQTYPNSRPPKEQWSAPEVLNGETPTIESDIFSFASLAVEVSAGQRCQ
ncbi:Receptor-like serine/threonine-protein kinase [Termitomyces sp. J132]|nr:Receptor-like serine/threonine-protein kinase [Termitomyces sp. J132]